MSQVILSHHNEGASAPLVIPYKVVCNTDEQKILENVLINARNVKRWIKTEQPHERVAVLCGSAPSLADTVDEIANRQKSGAEVFALNGAASFLADYLTPDYQVMMDAQPHTIELIGKAKNHLFASQMTPECFAAVPDAILWHATLGDTLVDEQDGFPQHDDDYCMIGSAASVGNTALVLLYAMGYREIHIYGMDSSHKDGKSHSKHQSINDGDPCLITHLNGKEYTCSFTMKLQADSFMYRANMLVNAGCSIEVHGSGYLPELWNARPTFENEQEKYARMWEFNDYRAVSPGENCAQQFIDIANPSGKVIDFGCGTGRGSMVLHRAGCEMLLIDFTTNSRDPQAMGLPFKQYDLTQPIDESAEFGFCTDVMEHIQPENVDAVINNIMGCVNKCFFQISLIADSMGEIIGQQLHLSVYPYTWWVDKFKALGYSVEWSEDQGISAVFYISNYLESKP